MIAREFLKMQSEDIHKQYKAKVESKRLQRVLEKLLTKFSIEAKR